MVRSINFLERKSSGISFGSFAPELQARLSLFAGALILGLLAVGAIVFAFNLRASSAEDQLATTQIEEQRISTKRIMLNATLAADFQKFEPILPRIQSIRMSGSQFADQIALIGNARPGRTWIDSIERTPVVGTVKLLGGALSLDGVAALLGSLSASGFAPHVTNVTPEHARGDYFSYILSAAPTITTATPLPRKNASVALRTSP